ncbi:MAG: hypothetical protein H6907_15525 [Hyphomicrobiales bacterium]|nr:hypothetical protein [Hyphomicrobiales bacterium]
MDRRELRLSPDGDRRARPGTPVTGFLAVAFGLLGLFTVGWLFNPIGLVFSLLALLFGQIAWGLAGLALAVAGFFASPVLLGLVGLTAIAALLPWGG